MYRIPIVVAIPLAVLFLFLLSPLQGLSEELPEGVTAQLVAEYPSNIPGMKKIQLFKITLQPGAVWKDIPVENTDLCNATQGTFTVVNQKTGTTTIYAEGSRWINEKGTTVTVSNPGDVPAVQWVYVLNEKG